MLILNLTKLRISIALPSVFSFTDSKATVFLYFVNWKKVELSYSVITWLYFIKYKVSILEFSPPKTKLIIQALIKDNKTILCKILKTIFVCTENILNQNAFESV